MKIGANLSQHSEEINNKNKIEIKRAVDEALNHGAGIAIDEYFNGVYVRPSVYFKEEDEHISKLKEIVRLEAVKSSISTRFIFALIETESDWEPWAVKYEPDYRWTVEDPNLGKFKCSDDTIQTMQSFSYGLCQIMGNHFYDFGFDGFCTQLLDPKLNIMVAIKILEGFEHKEINSPEELYATYNAGTAMVLPSGRFSNQENVGRFMRIYERTNG